MSVVDNFAWKLGTTLPIYLLGYFNFSVTWLLGALLLISLLREDLLKEKVSALPSWLVFPDVESTDWLNRILEILWPNVNKLFSQEVLMEMMEPKLQASLEPYKLGDIKCESIILGDIPPRIRGIKVHDRQISRSEIILDLEVYYAGNNEMTFNVKGMKGGIKDLQFHGLLRVVMKPLIPRMPLIGGLEIFFLNNPKVDFNLIGVIDKLPLTRDILHRVIENQLTSKMVYPNKLPIVLSNDVSTQILHNPAEVEELKNQFNARGEDNTTPLIRAAENNQASTVKALIDLGANLDLQDNSNRTALIWAASNSNTEICKMLLEAGADVNIRNSWDHTALMYAAWKNNIEIVKMLLAKGAQVNLAGNYGNTALHWAAIGGYVELAKLLVGHGANINVKNNVGATPLKRALYYNRTEVAKYLKSVGATV